MSCLSAVQQDAVLESHAGALPVADGLQEGCPRGQSEPKRAVGKTVGSAYVGSNPTPATTSENGPLAAETRPGGSFASCHAMYQGVSPRVDTEQWLRTYRGQGPGGTSGACNRSLCRFRGDGRNARWQLRRLWPGSARSMRLCDCWLHLRLDALRPGGARSRPWNPWPTPLFPGCGTWRVACGLAGSRRHKSRLRLDEPRA